MALLPNAHFFRLRLGLLFGRFHAALLLRSSSSGALMHRIRCVGRLRKRCFACSAFPQLTRLLRLHPAEIRGCAPGLSRFNFGNSAKVSLLPASFAPNKSFKPTPHRGVNSVLCATLHAVATPPWVGLTPALGGRKAFGGFAFQHGDFAGFGWLCSSVCFLRRCFFG